jgi:hypothetical protein
MEDLSEILTEVKQMIIEQLTVDIVPCTGFGDNKYLTIKLKMSGEDFYTTWVDL